MSREGKGQTRGRASSKFVSSTRSQKASVRTKDKRGEGTWDREGSQVSKGVLMGV